MLPRRRFRATPRQRRLAIPLPLLGPPAERAQSPFYRPAPHSNTYSAPGSDYSATVVERGIVRRQAPWSVNIRVFNAARKRLRRAFQRQGNDFEEADRLALDKMEANGYP